MEKKNWIKESIEFLREAMNKGVEVYSYSLPTYYKFNIERNILIVFGFEGKYFNLITPRGELKVPYEYSERDKLELHAMYITIQEYGEDMAIFEFEHYFKTDNEPKTVNDLDDDDE